MPLEKAPLVDSPPIYTINLSKPPIERYQEIALDFRDEIRSLTSLFDEVVSGFGIKYVNRVHQAARLLLQRLHNYEENEDLRGISKVTGVEMYLLVAFNTLLDLFMGCTSGGVRVAGEGGKADRMVHFRMLDWGMDALRKVVVQLEFVGKPGGPVVVRSVTYVGFVGVLTGVRKDLSVSLNFRPNHNNSRSWISNLRFYSHHLLVLLGLRCSVSSELRKMLIAPRPAKVSAKQAILPTLESITRILPNIRSTAAYLILSDGNLTTVFEKDHATALIRSSRSFVVATNHDAEFESRDTITEMRAQTLRMAGIDALVGESIDRKECCEKKWRKACERYRRRHPGSAEDEVCLSSRSIIRMLQSHPIMNECTHYAAVMDPMEGELLWVRRWLEPVVGDE